MITVSKQKIHLPRLDGDDYFERICAILSPDQPMKDEDESEYDPPQFEPPRASSKTLKCYQSFLTPKLPPGLKLKAIEDAGIDNKLQGFLCFHEGDETGFKAKIVKTKSKKGATI